MSTHAQPEPFDPKKHDWVVYMGQFRMFLESNSLQDETEHRKRALFLGYCGNHLYKTAKTLAAPKDVEKMEWKELQKILEEHYAPTASSLAHRLDFYRREQKPGMALKKENLYNQDNWKSLDSNRNSTELGYISRGLDMDTHSKGIVPSPHLIIKAI
ncbi:hypothetical protein E2320_021535 [Naja naja]|nr:hypothetical protein E2320_021535 [Naja naja]